MNTFITIWFICGIPAAIIAHGLLLAYFWHEFPSMQSPERFCLLQIRNIFPVFSALVCPLVVIMFSLECSKHGVLFRYPKDK